MPEKDVTPLAWKIELLLMDVDGVLTDGRLLLIPMPDGSVVEAKAFNVNDGAALAMARRAGLRIGIISGRSSAALTRRAEELKVDFFYHGLGRKKGPATPTGKPARYGLVRFKNLATLRADASLFSPTVGRQTRVDDLRWRGPNKQFESLMRKFGEERLATRTRKLTGRFSAGQ